MTRHTIIALLFVAAVTAPLLAATPAPPPPAATNVERGAVDYVVDGTNSFAIELYSALKGRQGNILFSPASIASGLSMARSGARGATADQLADALHLRDMGVQKADQVFQQLESEFYNTGRASSYKLRSGNGLWLRQGAGAFGNYSAGTVRNAYGAELFEVDFAGSPKSARKTIRAWARRRAWYWLGDFIPSNLLSTNTSMLLANVSLFEGRWAAGFNESFTQDSTFWAMPNRGVAARMMSRTGVYYYRDGKLMQTLELPLAGDVASMIVLLPKYAGALSTIERQMTPAYLKKWIGGMPPSEVVVSLPRFDLATVTDLTNSLMSLGAGAAFQSGAANFSGINGGTDLSLWSAIQKTRLIVNEQGGSGGYMPDVSRHPIADGLAYFNANRPFIFLIRDNSSGRILFMGRIVDPSE